MLNLNSVYLTGPRWNHQGNVSSCFGYDNSWVLAMFTANYPLRHLHILSLLFEELVVYLTLTVGFIFVIIGTKGFSFLCLLNCLQSFPLSNKSMVNCICKQNVLYITVNTSFSTFRVKNMSIIWTLLQSWPRKFPILNVCYPFRNPLLFNALVASCNTLEVMSFQSKYKKKRGLGKAYS